MGNLEDDRLERRGVQHTASGKSDELAGKVERGLGDLTDNKRLAAKGRARELKGKAKKGLGRAERNANDVLDDDESVIP